MEHPAEGLVAKQMPKRPLTEEETAEIAAKKAKQEQDKVKYQHLKVFAASLPQMRPVLVRSFRRFVCGWTGELVTAAVQIPIPTSDASYSLQGCYKTYALGLQDIRSKLASDLTLSGYADEVLGQIKALSTTLGLVSEEEGGQGTYPVMTPDLLEQKQNEKRSLALSKQTKEPKRPSYRIDSLSIERGAEWEPFADEEVIFAVPLDVHTEAADYDLVVLPNKKISIKAPNENTRILMIGRSVNTLQKTQRVVLDRDFVMDDITIDEIEETNNSSVSKPTEVIAK